MANSGACKNERLCPKAVIVFSTREHEAGCHTALASRLGFQSPWLESHRTRTGLASCSCEPARWLNRLTEDLWQLKSRLASESSAPLVAESALQRPHPRMLTAIHILLALASVSKSNAQTSSDPSVAYNLTTVLAAQPLLTNFTAALTNYTSLFNLVAQGNCTGKNSFSSGKDAISNVS